MGWIIILGFRIVGGNWVGVVDCLGGEAAKCENKEEEDKEFEGSGHGRRFFGFLGDVIGGARG